MSINTKMTALADEIRELSGTTEKLGLDAMTTNVSVANDTIDSQAGLIAQIASALEGKASGGSVEPVLQDKTVTPTISKQIVTADDNYDGLNTVTVNAMPTATQATPSITVNSSGLITASATQTAGYVSAGTKSDTKQLAIQTAKTITPSTSSQTAVSSGVYTTGAVTVNPIPSNYIIPSGIKSITSNGTHDVSAYASATVNVAGESDEGGKKTVTVIVKIGRDKTVYYYDENITQQSLTGTSIKDSPVTIEALCGLLFSDQVIYIHTGNGYKFTHDSLNNGIIFLEDGGSCGFLDLGIS